MELPGSSTSTLLGFSVSWRYPYIRNVAVIVNVEASQEIVIERGERQLIHQLLNRPPSLDDVISAQRKQNND